MDSELRFRGSGANPRFTKWLANLKQVGSNILVTGEVPDEVSARASRFLYGREKRRFRILALTDQTITSAESRLPEDAAFDDPTTWIIDQRRGERSVPATAGGVTAGLDPLGSDDARQLCDEIQSAIAFYDEKAEGLDPAELRVGVDSLFPLVEEDRSAAEHALRTLGATVRGVHGMAHYHLRVPADDEVVERLMPLFDARVELRKRPRQNPEQRWYAPKIDAKTPWMEL
ncbi:DUF7504 family protein [Halorussus caseinilyticus]|uniref:DUF7504 family protein n=1 Tax=Halorussus caseinilyticus TaxID=3034025 RepID=UPI0023E7CBBE|nr:hypothetical protein [Halorussus sp. DT72]